jgi:hypothetical protein
LFIWAFNRERERERERGPSGKSPPTQHSVTHEAMKIFMEHPSKNLPQAYYSSDNNFSLKKK